MLSQQLIHAIGAGIQASTALPCVIKSVQQVFGGDINQTYLLQTTTGNFFVKVNAATGADMFEKERAGLDLLRNTSTINVPKPIVTGMAEGYIYLVMEYIPKSKPAANFWQQFGHALAALHKNSNSYFGLDEGNYIGTIPQRNTQAETWAAFYRQQRIMPLMLKAQAKNKCTATDVQLAEKLCNKLGEIFPEEPPALLHGDLWSGNFMAGTDGQPVIFDPSVYYGHREMDIAMTMLFGGFDKKFYEYYNEAVPFAARLAAKGTALPVIPFAGAPVIIWWALLQ